MFSCVSKSKLDFISVTSFKKKNVFFFTEQMLKDIKKLLIFLHKIFYLRFLYYKISLCFSSFYSFRTFSSFFFSVNRYRYFTFFISLIHNVPFFFSSSLISYNYFFFLHINFFFSSFFFSFYTFFFLYFSYFFFFSFSFFFFYSFFYRRLGVSSLPTRIRKFTVLRSPHTDKKSREQFELRIHKRIVSFYSMYSSFFSYISYLSYNVFLCQSVHQCSTSYSDSYEISI